MKVKGRLVIAVMVLGFSLPALIFPLLGQNWEEPEEYYNIYEDGKDLFYARKYDRAKRKFRTVLRIKEDHRGSNRYLGRIYLKEQNYAKAIKYLKDCLRETSGRYRRQPLYYIGKAYEGAHRYSKALSIWREYVRRLTPPSTEREKRWLSQARGRIRSLKAQLKR